MLIAWYGRPGDRLTGQTYPLPWDHARSGTRLRDGMRFVVPETRLPAVPT